MEIMMLEDLMDPIQLETETPEEIVQPEDPPEPSEDVEDEEEDDEEPEGNGE
jgi:hypothetical protein